MSYVNEYGIRIFSEKDRIALYLGKVDDNSEQYLHRVASAIPVKREVCERLRMIPRHRALVPVL